MEINRIWAFPNSKTFKIKPIKQLIARNLKGRIIIDPFANDCSIKELMSGRKYISNDIDSNFKTDYHLDALDFLKQFEDESIDIVLYDPPYSPRQVSECYRSLGKSVNMQTTQSSYWSKQKKEIELCFKEL